MIVSGGGGVKMPPIEIFVFFFFIGAREAGGQMFHPRYMPKWWYPAERKGGGCKESPIKFFFPKFEIFQFLKIKSTGRGGLKFSIFLK